MRIKCLFNLTNRLVEELDKNSDKELKSRETQMKISDKDKRYLVTKLTGECTVILNWCVPCFV